MSIYVMSIIIHRIQFKSPHVIAFIKGA